MKKWMVALVAAVGLFGTVDAKDETGVIDFNRCIQESKIGKQEINSLEALIKQMAASIDKTEGELRDLETKLRNPDYIDSLSPEKEAEDGQRHSQLQQEIYQQRMQGGQMEQQAQMKLVQELMGHIKRASQVVAKDKGLDLILREDITFFYQKGMDVTDAVLKEMNRWYDKEMKG